MQTLPTALLLAAAVVGATPLAAQENYEIQVYGSETMAPGRTMFELHSNYTLDGERLLLDGVRPTYHAVHETLEITHGFNPWSELGFYVFTSANPGYGWQYVGSHVRPRVRAPESWHWPVGASLSVEAGFQHAPYSADTWSLEIRPIVDKQMGRWYASVNPTLGRAFRGPGTSGGLTLEPNVALTADVAKRVNLGVEYYGAVGDTHTIPALRDQEHVLYAVTNLDFGPDWEFNAGYGQGLTRSGDRRVIKMIMGRRVGRGR